MQQSDPLALKHGVLVGQVWEQIAAARLVASKPISAQQAAHWRRRLAHLGHRVETHKRLETSVRDMPAREIEDWFQPVLSTLERAAFYFENAGRAAQVSKQIPPPQNKDGSFLLPKISE